MNRFLFRLLHISFNFIGRKERRRLQNRLSMPIWMLPNQLFSFRVFLRFDCEWYRDHVSACSFLSFTSTRRRRSRVDYDSASQGTVFGGKRSDKKIESDLTGCILKFRLRRILCNSLKVEQPQVTPHSKRLSGRNKFDSNGINLCTDIDDDP